MRWKIKLNHEQEWVDLYSELSIFINTSGGKFKLPVSMAAP